MKNRQGTKMERQRQAILARLRLGPMTPDECRALGVEQPSTRIWELRRDLNVPIATVRTNTGTTYVLMQQPTA